MRHTKGQVLGRRTRRALNWAAVVAAMGAVGVVGVRSLRGGSAPRATVATATASRGDIVVSVGAVGRIVAARSTLQTAQPTVGTAAAPSLDAVYPSTRGNIARLLVSANQRVTRGQAIAVVDDGGAAASAVALAQTRLATASLEAQQSDDVAALAVTRAKADLEKLQGGTPVAHARALEVARRSVALAKQRLAGVGARPTAADLGAAESDVQKAEADLATLLQAAPAPAPEAVTAAQQAVTASQQRLARATGPSDPAAVKTAEAAAKKAEVDLATIVGRPDPVPTQAEIDAARLGLDAARAALLKLTVPDPTEVNTAKLEVEKARGDLATLVRVPSPATPQAVAAARQAIRAATLKRAKLLGPPKVADVTSARLDLERSRLELRNLEVGPSPTSLSAAQQGVAAASAKQELARSKPNVKLAAARLSQAQAAERRLTVVAPAPGTVTALLTQPGARVDPSIPVATVTDVDHLAAAVDLSEFDVARVRSGMRAIVGVDALGGKTFAGRVGLVALSPTSTGGVVTFPVQITLARSKGLRTGLNVSVKVIVAQRRKVVQVPLEAVSRDASDHPIVTVVGANGAQSSAPVTLGLANNKRVEIVKGLEPGVRVLLGTSGA